MPIRFRCYYCNQLMGISRRKAGNVVRCPKCARELIVPAPEGAELPEDPPDGPETAFESKNFDAVLEEPSAANGSAAETAAAGMAPEPTQPPTSVKKEPRRAGVFIPIGMLFLSFFVVVLFLILVFVMGLIIGRSAVLPADGKGAASAACGSALGVRQANAKPQAAS